MDLAYLASKILGPFNPKREPINATFARAIINKHDEVILDLSNARTMQEVLSILTNVAPHDAGDISADGVIAFTDGAFQKCVSDGVTPISITGGSEGSQLELWVENTGVATVTVTPPAPGDASTATTWDITAGKTAILLFKKVGASWVWVAVNGNF